MPSNSASMIWPRCSVTLNDGPSTDLAAVAPSRITSCGLTASSSASSHGRQARMLPADGVWWMRRLLPLGSTRHRKCLTALVT